MMTEICQLLNNWFDRGQDKYHGTFTITDGVLTSDTGIDMGIKEGQFYRIIGSALNDGVWRKDSETTLIDETFDGSVWLMAVPPAVVAIAEEAKIWQEKYGALDSPAMSPYNSESFAGYSYTKDAGGKSVGSGVGLSGWQAAFASRLMRWKKLG